MSNYSIYEENISKDELIRIYGLVKTLICCDNFEDLDLIFNIALSHPDRFPSINLYQDKNIRNYIQRWIQGYCDAVAIPPSMRHASQKLSCSDPAINTIVKFTQGFSDEEIKVAEKSHNLFMSAENAQGHLLEEYIASVVRPYGFLWCCGNVLRSIDFSNTEGSCFLQVKNKSNTENSSSSKIREGTKIIRWYRLGTQTKNKVKYPLYKWSTINGIVNDNKTEGFDLPACNMSEDGYQKFLIEKANNNNHLINDL